MKNKKIGLRFNLFLFFIVIVLIFAANFTAYIFDTKNKPDDYIAFWENDSEFGNVFGDKEGSGILVNNPAPKSEPKGADYLAAARFIGIDNISDTLTEYLTAQDGIGENPTFCYYVYAPDSDVKVPDAPNGITVYICAKRPVSGDNSAIDRDNSALLRIADENGYNFIDINLPLKGADGKLRAEYTGDYGDINEAGCVAALEWILTHIVS